MMENKRQGIIVYLHSLKHSKMLRKFGNVHYVSKRLKYVVLYCDMDLIEKTMEKSPSYSYVKKVEPA